MRVPLRGCNSSATIYGPTADNACIEEIETLLTRPVDLLALLGDQHRLAVMYGNLWWANLYLEWHDAPHTRAGWAKFRHTEYAGQCGNC
jgi:hypothetical protein